MATTEQYVGRPILRKEDAPLHRGPRHLHRQPVDGRHGVDGARSTSVCPREGRLHRRLESVEHARRDRRVHRRRPRRRVPRRPADGVAHHRGHQDPDALAAHERRDQVRRRRGRGRGRRVARSGGGCGRGGRGAGDRASRRARSGGSGQRPGRAPRGSRYERRGSLEPRGSGRPGDLRVRARRGPRAVHAAASDPECDRGPWLPRVRDAGGRRVHARVGHPDPAYRPRRALDRDRDPPIEAADHRARRRRRLRLEAERLRRGGPRPRARATARAAGEVDRGPAGELRRDDPRSRGAPRLHARGDRGREDPRFEVRRAGRHGRVLPAPHPGDPRVGRLGLHGSRTTWRRIGTSSRGS